MIRCSAGELRQSKSRAERATLTYFDAVAREIAKSQLLVSVNTDTDVESLKKSITSSEITWRCWWDGGTTGPITTRWGILTFPSVFVLDEAG